MSDNTETTELYRIVVETIIANERRRQQISTVFITLLVAGFGVAGTSEDFNALYATVPAAAVSLVWWLQIRFLKRLAAAKFFVISQLEDKFSYQPFTEEWRFLKRDQSSTRWPQFGLADIEMVVPILVFAASSAHIAWVTWTVLVCAKTT